MTILIATGNHESNRFLALCLSNCDYQIESALGTSEAMAILTRRDHPEVVILEWPFADDVETRLCPLIQEKRRDSFVYVLLFTRQQSSSWLPEMPEWTDDLLSEPFDRHELRVRVRAGFRIGKLQSDLVSR